MIRIFKSLVFWLADSLHLIAMSLPNGSKNKEDVDVNITMGEMVTPPPESFHIDRTSPPKKKRGRPPKYLGCKKLDKKE